MPSSRLDVPLGIRIVLPNTSLLDRKSVAWKSYILLLTFVIYTCFHASRKPLSVVKSVLNRNCSTLTPPKNETDPFWCDWKPFDVVEPNSLFGLLDSTFLFAYALSMFGSGFIAERMNLRYFLTIGTLGSGIFVYLFGLAKYYDVHSISYFLLVQLLGGIFQSAGWPGVVSVMGNWFGEKKTGFIFGVWNSHTSVGNILGTLIASMFVDTDWALSFMVIGMIMIVLAVIVFLFLVSEPTPLNDGAKTRTSDTDDQSEATGSNDAEAEEKARVEQHPILQAGQANNSKAIGFIQALRIPGVAEFSLCLFFAKLVSYTFLYWLPLYIHSSTSFSAEVSGYLSTLFDVGGILGGIFAGAISDYTGMQAFTCGAMLVYSVPMLYIYYLYGSTCVGVSIGLLLLTGGLVNGPYALITTAVSAKLGLDPTLAENTRALSTVTAIIDGTGSMGAAAGPLFAGFISGYLNWEYVFYMLMISDVFALCMLLRLMKNELQRFSRTQSQGWTS